MITHEITVKLTIIHPEEPAEPKPLEERNHDLMEFIADEVAMSGGVMTYDIIESKS